VAPADVYDDALEVEPLPTEIDNHADTICAGRNCHIESYTPYKCSVSSFLSEYQEQENVKICTALTATSLPSNGEMAILRLGQCLDFHDKLNKMLSNPNQLCAFGIGVCNDPTDEHHSLGIQLDDNTHLPLYMSGSICGLMTWSLTNEELESCCIIDVSDTHHWDPSNVDFNESLPAGNKRYSTVYSVILCQPFDCRVTCNDCILPLLSF
jgi:hypothetical protein